MRRETVNRIRFVLEELFPPILRDSFLFRWLFRAAWGGHVDELARFRQRAPELSDEEYRKLYEEHPRVQDLTDNSRACIDRIRADVVGATVCDVGCGTGHLLSTVCKGRAGQFERLVGVEIVVPERGEAGIEFVEAPVERLPFSDGEFDTVICTHVLEHILDLPAALRELRRVCSRRLIVVVPREREYLYTFNPHFHFFPYRHSFLRHMIPLPDRYRCEDVGRDIYYVEERN